MRIYCRTFYDPDMGASLQWFANKAEAERDLLALQQERAAKGEEGGPEGVVLHVIPATKAGLIGWLNLNFVSNNG